MNTPFGRFVQLRRRGADVPVATPIHSQKMTGGSRRDPPVNSQSSATGGIRPLLRGGAAHGPPWMLPIDSSLRSEGA